MKPRADVMPATLVGQNFAADRELTLPEKPRLMPELVVIPFGSDSLLVEGARGIQVLGGRAARSLLPRLMSLLDGTRTLDDIAKQLPKWPRNALHDAVSLLHSRGLLEDGRSPPPPPELADVDAFLGRFVDVTRVNRNRGEALDRLAAARIRLAGSADAAATMVQALAGSGFGEVAIGELDGATLVVVVATHEAEDLAPALAAAWDRGLPALHVRVGADATQIGPLFLPGKSGCYACMRTLHPEVPSGDADRDTASYMLGLAALHTFHITSRIADSYVYNVFHAFERTRHGTLTNDHVVARLPGCRRCGVEGPALDPHTPEGQTWLLHSSISMGPRELLSPRTHQNHYSAQNQALTREFADPYYGGSTVALPQPDPLDQPPPWAAARATTAPVTLAQLATLCSYAAGFRELAPGVPWRVAPTGGGLCSPDLFVIANHVAGLEDGIYHYYGPGHMLERLRDAPAERIRGALGVTVDLPPVVLIGTGALGRLRSKYNNFAYRLVNLDAGIALGYLHDVATALGLGVVEYSEFGDEPLTDIIGLPCVSKRNVVTFAVGVGVARTRPHRSFTTLRSEILDSVVEAAAFTTPASQPTEPVWLAAPAQGLGAGFEAPNRSFGEILMRRRSVRVYSGEPIPTPRLRALAVSASQLGRRRMAAGGPAVPVRLWLAVNRGDADLQPGIYELDPDRPGELVQRRAGCDQDQVSRCILQRGLAVGPAALFFTGDMGRALPLRGPRGYRELLLTVGTQAARVLMTASALGIAACASGGLLEDGFRAMTGTDGFRDCLLFSIGLGMPVSP